MTQNNVPPSSLRAALSVAFLLAAGTTLSQAQNTATWSGSSNTAWSNAANWDAAPADGDNIVIADTTTGATLLLDDGSHTIGHFSYGTNGTRANAFSIINTTNSTAGTAGLTFTGGLTAGNFTTAGFANSLQFRVPITISQTQTWTIDGYDGWKTGTVGSDYGVAIARNNAGAGNPNSLTLEGDLVKEGSGMLTICGTTVTGAGNIIVNEGVLKFNAGEGTGSGTTATYLTVAGGEGQGNITVNNDAALLIYKNSGTLFLSRDIVLNDGATLRTNAVAAGFTSNIAVRGNTTIDNLGDTVHGGIISGSGHITKSGSGALQLTGANSYEGGITINAGRVQASNITAFGTGKVIVNAGTGANIDGAEAPAGGQAWLTAAGTYTNDFDIAGVGKSDSGSYYGAIRANSSTSTIVGKVTLTDNARIVIQNGGNLTITGEFAGSGNFQLGGVNTSQAGNLILAGKNTHSGNITITHGTVKVTGTLGYTGTSGATDVGTYAGDIAVNNTAAGVLTFDQSANQTLTGVISGAGSLTKDGTGTLTLAGANTYTGVTTVNNGTLNVTGSLASTVTVDGGKVTGSGDITLTSGAEFLFDLSGGKVIDISGALDINGAELVLSGATSETSIVIASVGSISGVFSNYADGETFTYDGQEFTINYTGGSSITLTATPIPEPSTYALGAAGLLGALVLLRRRRK